MKNGFSESQLSKSGFVEVSPGVWSKSDLQIDASRSPASNLEQRPRSRDEGKAQNQSQREEAIQRGLRFRLVVHSFRTRLIDMSNPYFKAIEDCLTTHGVIPDDGPKFCDQPIFLQTRVPKGQERTEVEVLQVEGRAA